MPASRPSALLLLPTLLALAACSAEHPVSLAGCTEDLRPGLVVTPVDALTDTPAVQHAVLTVRDGDYVERSDRVWNGALYAAWERPGTYDVVVTARGYRAYQAEGVVVTADACHVTPVEIRAGMVRADG